MNSWKVIKLNEILKESKIIDENPDPDKKIRVKLNCNGVEKRPVMVEKKGATKTYIRNAGQFIYGKQNFHKGAFGIVPIELDGYSSSGDLPAFDIDDYCLPEWVDFWFKIEKRYLHLVKHAQGVGSKRVNIKNFLNEEIALPSISEQKRIISGVKKNIELLKGINTENQNQSFCITKLRQAILQEAIEGKLTADWRKENPVIKDDPDYDAKALLEKIEAEKDKLLVERKIKKQKPLAPIKPEEVPFELPEGWIWTRLGDVIKKPPINGYSPKAVNYPTNIKTLKLGATTRGVFNPSEYKYIDEIISDDSIFWLKPNDILIQRSNSIDYVGVSAIYAGKEKEFIYPDLMMKLKIVDLISVNYSLKAISAPFNREYYRKNAKGALKSMPKINQGVVNNTLFPLPPLAEQYIIVKRVEKLLTTVDELENQVLNRKNQAEMLMQSVLKEAFEGTENKPTAKTKSDDSEIILAVTPFQQMQLIAAVINVLEQQNQHQGEMIIAKYLYILKFITGEKMGFQFKKWHFGPYDPTIKKRISNGTYFSRQGKKGYETFTIQNKKTLLKYSSPLLDMAQKKLPEIIGIFSGTKDILKRDHKIELLATVLKSIEDSGKTEYGKVYYDMAKWQTNKRLTGFSSKAEKYSEQEVMDCITFIRNKGWIG